MILTHKSLGHSGFNDPSNQHLDADLCATDGY